MGHPQGPMKMTTHTESRIRDAVPAPPRSRLVELVGTCGGPSRSSRISCVSTPPEDLTVSAGGFKSWTGVDSQAVPALMQVPCNRKGTILGELSTAWNGAGRFKRTSPPEFRYRYFLRLWSVL